MLRVSPGVVSGASYAALIKACHEGGYALPAINVVGTDSVNAVLEAAARNGSDVVIQVSNGGARFYAGEGLPDAHRARVLGAASMARHVHLLAKEYGIAVILHTDHADRRLIPWLNDLITMSEDEFKATGKPLFTSHMLDLSTEPLEENLATSAAMLKRLAPLGMGLEIELGVTGGEEDGIGHDLEEGADNAHLYTQPEDVLKAWNLLSPIGTVSIAASFGNVHGVYKPGNVQLRPEILKNSQDAVQKATQSGPKPLPLVFHGGSGSTIGEIDAAVSYGVFKMNLDTDIQFAFAHGVGSYVLEHPVAFQHQIEPGTDKPMKSLYDPRKWLRVGEKSIVERLDEAFEILGSKGRSVARKS
ncbi:class II fructose-bisphosphate aldolase [Gluconobacter roseus]|uniref:Fructose-bisphosphate aldolase n=1 Tax=Gluconobacter roseus NBRC 3990 TaxID=1307950 RepID=A0A4Y3MAA5_9PROT|nr:class II fructose-bisphosphate aldolase [Gluconobacter roseus]KXV42845.1 fructose-bisphosphate aldolase [Gluconobacter roseus]GBR48911.1 fructose-bisphosphate aldolase [Gluconobacter roseus NBRC 3990]GEB04318.1 fructose-bisphosphate aldolase [Gluconobacter roseus NBRC 3990]GLP92761.1 fructose-bisphosphate aldolase [Gluconobacter roseus NBRC 3990]